MLNTKEIQINFLDSLFTQKDFYFLNSLEQEIELIQNQIKKQEEKRELIIEVINYCENKLSTDTTLNEVKNCFNLVNSNIKSLLFLKQNLTDINSSIVNLLVSIESNPNNKETHTSEANKLSNSISEYNNFCVTKKTEIANNDLALNQFFSSDKFKNFFNNITDNTIDFSNDIKENETESNNIDTNIENNSNDDICYYNNILRISEKENKVFLPYTNTEIKSYLTQFSEDYKSAEDVIEKEFIIPLAHYMKHPVLSRFRETYSLIRDREAKPIMEAIKYSMNLMFTYELNPTIIAACKTQNQLENYLDCLQNNELNNFKDFEIKFEINPL